MFQAKRQVKFSKITEIRIKVPGMLLYSTPGPASPPQGHKVLQAGREKITHPRNMLFLSHFDFSGALIWNLALVHYVCISI